MKLNTHYSLLARSGQSMIETIVAIFVLTMALTAGLGLAVYALSSSATAQYQVVATNLAREGIEVARDMRDSNWMSADVAADPSFYLSSCADVNGRYCYPKVLLGPPFALAAGSYQVVFDPVASSWSLAAGNNNYNIYQQADGTYTYTNNGTISSFARKLSIVYNSNAPFTSANPEVILQSIVGWRGKNCNTMVNSDPATTNCKIVAEEHLTNWKDYK